MSIVKLELDDGPEQGYRLNLTSLRSEHFESTKSNLPALTKDLNESFEDWRSVYYSSDSVRKMNPGFKPKGIKQSSSQARDKVKNNLNQWLNSGNDSRWQHFREELILLLNRSKESDEEIQILLDAEDLDLSRYPWQEWDLLESRFPQAEIAIRVRGKGSNKIRPIVKAPKVKILMVEGENGGLDTHLDVEVIRSLEARGAEVKCLSQPTREQLSEAFLEEDGYHIFIFSGHSRSDKNGKIGWIGLKKDDELSIDEFKRNFRVMIDRGLQLAIFNSCDGLGLAHQLAELNLPQCIVMQEPIPDEVAVKFLKNFFDEFTRNKSLFAAMHRARTALESFDNSKQYPGVVWLPTLCTRESALDDPLTWEKLIKPETQPDPFPDPEPKRKKWPFAILGVLAAGLIGGIVYSIAPVSAPKSCPTQAVKVPRGLNGDECLAYVSVPSGSILHGGSTTWAPIRDKINPKIETIHPQFKLTYQQPSGQAPGSGTGINMLIKNQISFAESSRSLLPEEVQAGNAQGFLLKSIPVAIDAIAIVVHPSLEVKGLTVEHLRKIYRSEITNWNQVGGPDLPITPYSRPLESGTTEFFKENILGNQAFGTNVISVPTTTDAIRKLSQNKGGIYYATASEVVSPCGVKPLPIQSSAASPLVAPYQEPLIPPGECPGKRNQLNVAAFQEGQYPVTRRIFVIVKQDGSVDEKAGEAYANLLLTSEGQKLVKAAGFIPMRSTDE
ncbi:MAG: substrate-binding domain-containing protein [Microcoleaceae cyanobacterium]